MTTGTALCTFSHFLTDPETLGGLFQGESWRGWRTIAKAIYGEKLTKKETVLQIHCR